MKKPSSEDDLLARTAIDARAAFTTAAFLTAGGLIALLDRIGGPERLAALLTTVCALIGLAAIGATMRTMRVSSFYAAGRAAPPSYAGAAMAVAAIGLIMPFASGMGVSGTGASVAHVGLLAGCAVGLMLAAFAIGPLLRKTGAFSLSDLLAARFPGTALRLGAALTVSVACCCLGLAGFGIALEGLRGISDFSIAWRAAIIAVTLALIVAPGGLSGALWAGAAALGVALYAFCEPLALIFFGDFGQLAPVADVAAFKAGFAQIVQWSGLTSDFSGGFDVWATACASALGAATLAPLLTPAICARDRHAASVTGLAGIFWTMAIAAAILTTMTASTLALLDSSVGRRPDQLPSLIYQASARGHATICGVLAGDPQTAANACRPLIGEGRLRPSDLRPRGLFLLTAAAQLAGLGAAQSGMSWAGFTILGLGLAALAFQGVATALGNDAFYRTRASRALASRRLAIARLSALSAIILSAFGLSRYMIDPEMTTVFALALSCAGLAPLLALAFYPRARSSHASLALVMGVGAFAVGATIDAPSLLVWMRAALIGAATAICAGIGSTFLTRGENPEAEAFIKAMLHDPRETLTPDKGA